MDGGDIPKPAKNDVEVRVGGFEDHFNYPREGEILVAANTGGQTRHEVDVAGVKSVEVPSNWSQTTESYLGGRGLISTFSPGGNTDVVLSVLDKGSRLNQDQTNALDAVLNLADHNGRPRVLLPSQIKSITEALGTTTVGDNQYTNTAKPPDPTSPVFKIMSAQVITVDGKPVVEVDGQFVNENGQRVRDYIGIFGKGDGGHVNQMFLQSSSKDEYIKGRKVYKDALQSLDWK